MTTPRANTGCGTLIAVALVAFVVGRCSAESPGSSKPDASTAQAFIDPAIAAAEDAPSPEAKSAPDDSAEAAPEASDPVPSETASDDAATSAAPAEIDVGAMAARAGAGAGGDGYIDVDGHQVSSPVFAPSAPDGASARCRDGSYSFSHHRRGTCSRHGGVAEWL